MNRIRHHLEPIAQPRQEASAEPTQLITHIVRLGRSRARWRMLAVSLIAALAGFVAASFD